MIVNNIEKIRTETQKYFETCQSIDGSDFNEISPSKNYKLETALYKQSKPDVNWEVTKVSISDLKTNEVFFDFFLDSSEFFHSWIMKDNTEFLMCAEVLCGGQTVIDLTHRKMESYAAPEEGFIWTSFNLSPSGNKLAVIGCYWACPYEIKIYEFNNPLVLPLAEIETIPLETNNDNIEWIDDQSFKIESYDGKSRVYSIALGTP